MTVIFQDNRSRTPKYFHLRQSIEGLKRNKRWKYLGMCGVFITFANMNEIKIMYARKAMLTAALLIMGQSAALAACQAIDEHQGCVQRVDATRVYDQLEASAPQKYN